MDLGRWVPGSLYPFIPFLQVATMTTFPFSFLYYSICLFEIGLSRTDSWTWLCGVQTVTPTLIAILPPRELCWLVLQQQR